MEHQTISILARRFFDLIITLNFGLREMPSKGVVVNENYYSTDEEERGEGIILQKETVMGVDSKPARNQDFPPETRKRTK